MTRLFLVAGALGLAACGGTRGVGFDHYDTTSQSTRKAVDIEAEYEALLVQRGLKVPVIVTEEEKDDPAATGN